jgi:putative endonuclease
MLVATTPQDLGLLGERLAARWLVRRGWSVIAHRYRNGHWELDLIVRKDQTVAFVEVKTRSDLSFGGPIAALNYYKLGLIRRSAIIWMSRYARAGFEYRIDVVGVVVDGLTVKVRHVENAFSFHVGR